MYSRSVPTLARESFGKGKERERGSLDVMRNWIKRDKDNAVATLESRPKRLKNRTKIRVKIEGKGGESFLGENRVGKWSEFIRWMYRYPLQGTVVFRKIYVWKRRRATLK